MFKGKVLIALALLVLAFSRAQLTETLFTDGTEDLRITYLSPQPGEAVRLRVRHTLDANLVLLTQATLICARTDSSYVVNANAPAFAIQAYCTQTVCDNNNNVGHTIYGSHMINASTWAGSGVELASSNMGIFGPSDGMHVDTVYAFSSANFIASHLPGESEVVYARCCHNYGGSFFDALLSGDVDIDSEWECSNFSMNVPPCPSR